jgi:hypothetical protein
MSITKYAGILFILSLVFPGGWYRATVACAMMGALTLA